MNKMAINTKRGCIHEGADIAGGEQDLWDVQISSIEASTGAVDNATTVIYHH